MNRSSRARSDRLLLAGVIALAVGWPGLGTAAVSTTGVKIEAGDAIAQAYFGTDVDISGDTLVVGAPQDDPWALESAGSAYVFVRAGEAWVQQAKLDASDAGAGDFFGTSVAISGDTVVVGAPENDTSAGGNAGSVYVFTRSGTSWSQEASITADDAAGDDALGISVDISGETIVAGACRNDTPAGVQVGSAYVFTRSGTTWSQQASLTAGDGAAEDYFGVSVAISGDTVVAGAHSHDPAAVMDAGAAYVFTRSGTAWSVQTSLTADDAGLFDQFGGSVAVSSDTILVGSAWNDTAAASSAGAAYVYTRSGTTWSQEASLTASDAVADDIFGSSVSLSGDTAVVGAKYRSGIAGAAYVFARSGGTWSQQPSLTATDAAAGDRFGVAVAVDNDTVVVGADGDETAAGDDAGSAWVFPPENGAPVAVDDTSTTVEDTTFTVVAPGLLANDTDPNGDTLEVAGYTTPAHGSLVMTVGTGAFAYRPDADWAGVDTFAYRSTDGSLTSNWATVTITVTAANDAPVASDDVTATLEDTVLPISLDYLRANDSNVDTDLVWLDSYTQPANGSVSWAPGVYVYTPDANWVGVDTFTYTISDGVYYDTAVVTVTVTPVNDMPIAVEDTATVAEDTTLTVEAPGLLANDTDADGDTRTIGQLTQPLHGTIDVPLVDGGFTYRPNANWYGTDTFTYCASDGTTKSAWTTMTITVTPVNDVPVAVEDTYTVLEDTTLTIDAAGGWLANDTDAEGTTLVAIRTGDPSHVATWTWADNGSFTYKPAPNFTGVDHAWYYAYDGSLGSDGVTVTITVTPVNDVPIAVSDSAACAVNGSVTFNVLFNDTDVEGSSLAATLTTAPLHGVVTLTESGDATYTPTAGWYGTDAFTYVASDGTTDSAPAIVTLTVSAPAPPPPPPPPAPDPVPVPAPVLRTITGHSLYTPVTPSTVYYGRGFTISSFLKPRHKAGLYSLKYEGYRYERQSNGTYKWVRRATWYGKNYNYSTYTKCIKTGTVIKLRGKWKVRAVHTQTGYVPKFSAWRYFTVR